MIENIDDISIRECIENLLYTKIIKNLVTRIYEKFAKKLVFWLIRYIIFISSMKESLKINIEDILQYHIVDKKILYCF